MTTYKNLLVSLLLLLSIAPGWAQKSDNQTTLDSCLMLARANYPQINQFDLLTKSAGFSLENAQKGKLPQISIIGQATYQSEVTGLPSGAAMGIEPLSKDQYRLYGEITQSLTDLAVINQQKKIITANSIADVASVEVSLYKINERVSDLYFGVLLLDEQINQTNIYKSDLEIGLQSVQAAIKYGTALRSNEDVLQAELLGLNQRLLEQKAAKNAFLKMLGLFIGRPLAATTSLEEPQIMSLNAEITRPELSYFNSKMQMQNLQSDLLKLNNLPKFSLFFQSGMGRPALNMLSNEFAPYYIGGLRFSWRLTNYYTANGQRQIFAINKDMITVEKETFLFNTNLALQNQLVEISKMEELLTQDDQIIKLRERIITTAKDQLENGVITTNDFKTILHDADKARQNKAIHKIQFIKSKYSYNLASGL